VQSGVDLQAFDVLTFDCYGTLIDWEAGLSVAYGSVLRAHGTNADADELLVAHGRHETHWEGGPYVSYREVLVRTLRDVCAALGVTPDQAEEQAFADSVGSWPPFPDSAASLVALGRRYRLGVITNCDDDLFELSRQSLGADFDFVITAQRARSYKPSLRPFELALEAINVPREKVLHVAQSLFHDHVPARQLGLRTAWIDRRRGRLGPGATPPASAEPDLAVPDMATFSRLALSSGRSQ
jgi:2-haloacid dehalogenase